MNTEAEQYFIDTKASNQIVLISFISYSFVLLIPNAFLATSIVDIFFYYYL